MTDKLRHKVSLRVSCKDLPNRDTLSKTDAYVTVSLETSGLHESKSIGKSETVKDELNPRFSHSFNFDYYFERIQNLTFEVFDDDGKGKSEKIASATAEVGEIMSARGQFLKLPLSYREKKLEKAVLVAYLEETKEDKFGGSSTEVDIDTATLSTLSSVQLGALLAKTSKTTTTVTRFLELTWHGVKFDKKDLLGKSDPYIKFMRLIPDADVKDAICVFTSETVMKTLDPTFKPIRLPLQEVCNNDPSATLLVQCWDWDKHSAHDLIGEFQITVRELSELKEGAVLSLIHPEKKAKKKDYENSGTLVIDSARIAVTEAVGDNPRYDEIKNLIAPRAVTEAKATCSTEFVRYLAGGCEVSIIFGIDFTGSNGAPSYASSLHYLGGTKSNSYQEAIQSIGRIVQPYDSDKQFPVYGYGAGVTGKTGTLAAFNCQGFLEEKKDGWSDLNLVSKEIEGVLSAYAAAVPKLSFGDMGSAPRKDGGKYRGDDFYQLITQACDIVGDVTQDKQKYSILLLVIDGDYFDNQATIDAIVAAGDKPISIIIVGVGNSTFPNCVKFDADDEPLVNSKGVKMTRDVVQFVPYKKFAHDSRELAAQVLAELPLQLVQFMKSKGIAPKPRPSQEY